MRFHQFGPEWPLAQSESRPVGWGKPPPVTTFVQAVIGAILSRREGVVLDDMHALYGFSAIIAVAHSSRS